MKALFRSFVLSAAAALICAGCATKPRATSITIAPATKYSVNVDLVGVPDGDDLIGLKNIDVSAYWQAGNPVRRTADKFEVHISGGKADPPVLSETDPIWATWFGKGVTHVIILADLPGEEFKGTGTLDPRRKDIDLRQRYVDKTITVEIQDTAVKIKTPLKQ